jgi:hypothetical protein
MRTRYNHYMPLARRLQYSADWEPWVQPPVKRRKRVHRLMKQWRDYSLSRRYSVYVKGRPRFYGLRLWVSRRYPDARAHR